MPRLQLLTDAPTTPIISLFSKGNYPEANMGYILTSIIAALIAGTAVYLLLRAKTANLQSDLTEQSQNCIIAETKLAEQQKAYEEKLALLSDAEKKLSDSFKALSAEALKNSNTQFLQLAKTHLDKYQQGAKNDLDTRQKAIDELVKPLKESLKNVDTKLTQIDKQRAEHFATLTANIKSLATSEAELKKETANLVTALRKPQVRGRWGEIQLRRVVEIAGMVEHCDFDEQKGAELEGMKIRPDMVVNLPNGRHIVVDSKAPLESYLQSLESGDDDNRTAKLKDHARLVRTHIQNLGAKSYWAQFQPAPEFVILFRSAQHQHLGDGMGVVGGELRIESGAVVQQAFGADQETQVRIGLAGEHRVTLQAHFLGPFDFRIPIGALDQAHHEATVVAFGQFGQPIDGRWRAFLIGLDNHA